LAHCAAQIFLCDRLGGADGGPLLDSLAGGLRNGGEAEIGDGICELFGPRRNAGDTGRERANKTFHEGAHQAGGSSFDAELAEVAGGNTFSDDGLEHPRHQREQREGSGIPGLLGLRPNYMRAQLEAWRYNALGSYLSTYLVQYACEHVDEDRDICRLDAGVARQEFRCRKAAGAADEHTVA
jgi:hypothetical protein